MKTRILLSFVLAVVLCSVVLFAVATTDGGEAIQFSNVYALDEKGINNTSEITFTPVATAYLPLVLKNYGFCSTVPELLAPENGGQLNTIAPLFKWYVENNPYVTQFRMEVARDSEFKQGVTGLYASGIITGTREFRFSHNFDPATTYYWRAWVMCGNTQGPYSAVWSFTTGSGGTILDAPTLVAPANGSQLPSTVATLQWSAVPGAVEYLVHWRRVGWSGYSYRWVNETQTTISWLSPNTTYEWWISARNEYAIGRDSETWRFTTGGSSSSVSGFQERPMVVEDGAVIVAFRDW